MIAGPTRIVADRAPEALSRIAIHLPPWHAQALLGPSDVVLAALFVAGASRVGLSPLAAALGVGTGLVVATGAALGTGATLPVVPFMAAGLLWAGLGGAVFRRRA